MIWICVKDNGEVDRFFAIGREINETSINETSNLGWRLKVCLSLDGVELDAVSRAGLTTLIFDAVISFCSPP
jgi:hypothetical protein